MPNEKRGTLHGRKTRVWSDGQERTTSAFGAQDEPGCHTLECKRLTPAPSRQRKGGGLSCRAAGRAARSPA